MFFICAIEYRVIYKILSNNLFISNRYRVTDSSLFCVTSFQDRVEEHAPSLEAMYPSPLDIIF